MKKLKNIFFKKHKILGRSKKIVWITDFIIILVVSLGITLAYNIYYMGKFKENIVLEIQSINSEIVSGREESFELSYQNQNKKIIKNANLTINLPQNFILTKTSPEDIFDPITNTFNLGNLYPGANGKIKITGIVLGEVNSKQNLIFLLNYKQNTVNVSTSSSFSYQIDEALFDLKIAFPKKIYKNVSFETKINLKNKSQQKIKNIEINFINDNLKTSTSNYKKNERSLQIDDLNELEEKDISLNQIINSLEGEQNIKIECYADINDQNIKLFNISKNVLIHIPGFKTQISTKQNYAPENKQLNFILSYKNESDQNINQVVFNPSLNDNFRIQKLNIEDPSGKFILKNNIIILNQQLLAQESGNIKINLEFQKLKSIINQNVYLKMATNYENEFEKIEYQTQSTNVKILSNLEVNSRAYYYSPKGDQLGIGPLPPIVDIPTNYWIFWEINNLGNDLSNFEMKAQLPKNVTWTKNINVLNGELQYTETDNYIIWKLDQINAQGNYKVGFEISLIPKLENVDQVLPLIYNLKYQTFDNFCETELSQNLKNLDTNLKYDHLSLGKGKVESFE
ncbi:hypothetical protein K8R66_02270 [bacterium]|nr:hypothetical protein [bacterium]